MPCLQICSRCLESQTKRNILFKLCSAPFKSPSGAFHCLVCPLCPPPRPRPECARLLCETKNLQGGPYKAVTSGWDFCPRSLLFGRQMKQSAGNRQAEKISAAAVLSVKCQVTVCWWSHGAHGERTVNFCVWVTTKSRERDRGEDGEASLGAGPLRP